MRRFAPLTATLVAVALTCGWGLVLAAGGVDRDIEAGKAVYVKKCKSCHGATGEGNAALAKALKVPIRDLGSPEVQKQSDAELRKNSLDGVGKMKAVKDVSETDAENLMAYLRSLKKDAKF